MYAVALLKQFVIACTVQPYSTVKIVTVQISLCQSTVTRTNERISKAAAVNFVCRRSELQFFASLSRGKELSINSCKDGWLGLETGPNVLPRRKIPAPAVN
jgi:hypothetical protein